MKSKDIDELVDNLSEDEKIVLRQLPRIYKSHMTNTFHEEALHRRKACLRIDVKGVLKNLANLGLVYRIARKGYWRTTSDGQWASHKLQEEAIAERYEYRILRGRPSQRRKGRR